MLTSYVLLKGMRAMVVVSIPALYDGKEVRLLEAAPHDQPYHVVVTFVEPASSSKQVPPELSRFWSSFGDWQDDVSPEETMRMIRESRHSKVEPPKL